MGHEDSTIELMLQHLSVPCGTTRGMEMDIRVDPASARMSESTKRSTAILT
jgi:hypothetical protein